MTLGKLSPSTINETSFSFGNTGEVIITLTQFEGIKFHKINWDLFKNTNFDLNRFSKINFNELITQKYVRVGTLFGEGHVISIVTHLQPIWGAMLVYFYYYRYMFKNSAKVGLQEAGPRFTLKLWSLQHGTFNTTTGEYIWLHNVSVSNCTLEIIYNMFLITEKANGHK